jgi:drug/metabolite transporter (DMT)-like permease
MKLPAPLFALSAATLFALGVPSSKLLLNHVSPTMLAGLLYFGSGIGLSCLLVALRKEDSETVSLANLPRRDLGFLVGSTTIGGIVAPLLLMTAMSLNKASTVSLLMNFEVVFVAIIARCAFKEHLGWRVSLGLLAILLGGVCLSWSAYSEGLVASWSLLLGVAACFCWAVDSNLAGQISGYGPMQIARFKGLLSGIFNISLAILLGYKLPALGVAGGAALTGIFAYGLSLSLFIMAMRRLGAARAMGYFSTEPFMGALLCVVILKDPLNLNLLVAAVLMSIGVWLHLTEKNDHLHKGALVIAEGVVQVFEN